MALGIPHYVKLSKSARAAVVAAQARAEAVFCNATASASIRRGPFGAAMAEVDRSRVKSEAMTFARTCVTAFASQVREASRNEEIEIDRAIEFVEERIALVSHYAYHDIDAEKVQEAFGGSVGSDREYRCTLEIANNVKASCWPRFLEDLTSAAQSPQHAATVPSEKTPRSKFPEVVETKKVLAARAENSVGLSWGDVELRFIAATDGETVVDVITDGRSQRLSYAALGFSDKRKNGRPRKAWKILIRLAHYQVIRQGDDQRKWDQTRKHFQDLRTILKQHFRIDADPLVARRGECRTAFKVSVQKPAY